MRTVRSGSRLFGGSLLRGVLLWGEGVCSPRGSLLPVGRGLLLGGLLPWGMSAAEGVCSRGVGFGIPAGTEADPPQCGQTDTSKNGNKKYFDRNPPPWSPVT